MVGGTKYQVFLPKGKGGEGKSQLVVDSVTNFTFRISWKLGLLHATGRVAHWTGDTELQVPASTQTRWVR